jgi:hypothetical protein
MERDGLFLCTRSSRYIYKKAEVSLSKAPHIRILCSTGNLFTSWGHFNVWRRTLFRGVSYLAVEKDISLSPIVIVVGWFIVMFLNILVTQRVEQYYCMCWHIRALFALPSGVLLQPWKYLKLSELIGRLADVSVGVRVNEAVSVSQTIFHVQRWRCNNYD